MITTFWCGPDVPDATYLRRTCVYGVTFDEQGRVLLVRYKGRWVLPGGGIDDGESEADALIRETLEETGYHVEVGDELGRARQLVSRPEVPKYRDKSCSFFRVRIAGDAGGPTEPGHERFWRDVDVARPLLAYGSHAWAIDRAIT